MNKPDYLRKLFITNIRKKRGNNFITIKKGDEVLFDDLAKILDLEKMDGHDYIQYHFTHHKFIPSANYITSSRAIQSYTIHQKLKRKYYTESYVVDGNDFYVNKTFKKYPMTQVEKGASDDPVANYALVIAADDNTIIDQDLIDAVEYTLCKLEYKEKPIPDTLLKLKEKIDDQKKGFMEYEAR